MTGELAPRDARSQIAGRQYENTDSIKDALTDRQRMAAAVEVAKKARVDAAEWMWTAREAERTLGRMINEARDAGDLATGGERNDLMQSVHKVPTLDDMGIEPHLAAYAIRLPSLPDKVWEKWHEDLEPTRAKVASAAADYWAAAEAAKRRVSAAEEDADDAKAEVNRARRRQEEARKAQPVIPPLTEDETSLVGADISLDAAVASGEAVGPPIDRSREAKMQGELLASMTALARRVQEHDPYLSNDGWRDVNVMAARDAARRLTDSVAVWLRTLNTLYGEAPRS